MVITGDPLAGVPCGLGLPLFLLREEIEDARLASETIISSSEITLTRSASRDDTEPRLTLLLREMSRGGNLDLASLSSWASPGPSSVINDERPLVWVLVDLRTGEAEGVPGLDAAG